MPESFRKGDTMKFRVISACLLILFLVPGCGNIQAPTFITQNNQFITPEKTAEGYEKAGLWWGQRHLQQGLRAGDIDIPFVNELVNKASLDYFWVHSDLKDAFIKGYRLGYQDRTADLVLGPNVTSAAGLIGEITSQQFVDVITAFEQGWAKTLKRAIDQVEFTHPTSL